MAFPPRLRCVRRTLVSEPCPELCDGDTLDEYNDSRRKWLETKKAVRPIFDLHLNPRYVFRP